MKRLWLRFAGATLVWALAACSGIVVPPPETEAGGAECLADFDPTVNYFPQRSAVTHAEGFGLTYFDHYKVLEVHTPWPGADASEIYLLAPCGAPRPAGYPDARMIEVPIRSLVALSTTYLPHLEALEQTSLLVGVDNDWTIYSEAMRRRIEDGQVAVVGGGPRLDLERVLQLDPDLIMAYSLGSPDQDAHPALRAAHQSVLLNAEFLEPQPLGRAEWIKVTAALVNQEAAANAYFDAVVAAYAELQALARTRAARPSVLVNTPWEGVWYASGGASFQATFLRDAGADYLWADNDSRSALFLDFETVFAQGRDADYWLNVGQFKARAEMLASDARFAEFKAFRTGRVYNNDRRVSPRGANDSWESAVIRPHDVLADLIAIFHPDLLPEHEFVYYRRLD